ncbi:ATP-binding protein [Streptomyces gilvus]|uniref:ATP-binding protein n=1 Tax=Streptomyces gilvus TaxID=2920937 RepID=UPI001F10AA51|nr:LuxR C-terminal-related transcriptional regulator [Streptomyces sp. CME 23]MCH5675627.1 LuxR C-terminal-related transcriptional regulator [Streptomyces sp. CME 23]
MTTFVGRQTALADVKQALSTSRLVTLVGPGGVGKTRLALRAASASQRAFRDGTWFVDISPLRDEELLASTIAYTLELQTRSSRWASAALSRQLANRSMLLVLDNCEHLSYACAVMADLLLKNCPNLRVLTTSRQPLEVAGEHLISVSPLAVPEPREIPTSTAALARFDAIALFVDRARAVEPRFRLTEENTAAVAELCIRLDGLPLAVELAAARVRHFSPQQILARLDNDHGLLDSGSRVTALRQRSLRTLIGWSHDLCSPAERLLWARLTVFSGSFSAEAAEAVCSDGDLPRETVLATLTGLVDKSIVATDRGDSEVRYRMLATIRSFGHRQLLAAGEDTTFRRRHRDYFSNAISDQYHNWFGSDQLSLMTFIRAERDNLRAALDFALTQRSDLPRASRVAAALGAETMQTGLMGEGRHWIDRVLAVLEDSDATRPMLLWIDGWCALQQGDLGAAESMLEAARATAHRVGDHHEAALAAAYLGNCRMLRGELRRALDLFEQVRGHLEEGHDPMCRSIVTLRAGATAWRLGDTAQGIALCREAIAISDSHGEQWHKAEALGELSDLLSSEGDLDESAGLAREALRIQLRFRNALGTAQSFETLAWIANRQSEHERAARLLGAADALWEATDAQPYPHLQDRKERCVTETASALGGRAYEEAYRRGRESSREDNAAFALCQPAVRREVGSSPAVQLTKRERQIAELLSTGASNKEIAAALVISPRTVEGHVVHILGKLGFTSRVQIAAWVATQHTAVPIGEPRVSPG